MRLRFSTAWMGLLGFVGQCKPLVVQNPNSAATIVANAFQLSKSVNLSTSADKGFYLTEATKLQEAFKHYLDGRAQQPLSERLLTIEDSTLKLINPAELVAMPSESLAQILRRAYPEGQGQSNNNLKLVDVAELKRVMNGHMNLAKKLILSFTDVLGLPEQVRKDALLLNDLYIAYGKEVENQFLKLDIFRQSDWQWGSVRISGENYYNFSTYLDGIERNLREAVDTPQGILSELRDRYARLFADIKDAPELVRIDEELLQLTDKDPLLGDKLKKFCNQYISTFSLDKTSLTRNVNTQTMDAFLQEMEDSVTSLNAKYNNIVHTRAQILTKIEPQLPKVRKSLFARVTGGLDNDTLLERRRPHSVPQMRERVKPEAMTTTRKPRVIFETPNTLNTSIKDDRLRARFILGLTDAQELPQSQDPYVTLMQELDVLSVELSSFQTRQKQ